MNKDLTRPGVSPQYLEANGVRHVSKTEAQGLVGCPEEGLLLPYYLPEGEGRVSVHDPTDKPFCRLRKEGVAFGYKYHQPAGTQVHSYLPANWLPGCADRVLNLVEGEFKGLSLTDPANGFVAPTVSLTGFYSFHLKLEEDESPRPTPELAMALGIAKPERVNFIGDNDTTCNFDFSIAACRMREMLPNVPVFLPRISLVDPKGVDDCRQQYGPKFERWFRTLEEDAIEVTSDLTPDLLALKLIERALPTIVGLSPTLKSLLTEKFAKLASRAGDAAREQLIQMLGKPLGIGKTTFRKLVATQPRLVSEASHEARLCRIRPQVQGFFYDGRDYYRQNGESYSRLSGRDNLLLALQNEMQLGAGSTSDAELGLYLIQRENVIGFAGAIAGRSAGMLGDPGSKILITSGPTIIPSTNVGDATLIVELLADFMGRQDDDPYAQKQLTTLLGWLKQARVALAHPETHLPGQALILVGPADIGKGFLQEHFFTWCLGGRKADPGNFLSGRTQFNDTLFGAEHWLLSDPTVDPDEKSRTRFKNELKRLVANETHSITKKYASTIDVRPVGRFTMSVNMRPSDLGVIPMPCPATRDKMILLKCYRPAGLPGPDPVERAAFQGRMKQALPAFLGQLEKWVLPEHYRDARFGVVAFHHPDILQGLRADDPEAVVGGMVDMLLKQAGNEPLGLLAQDWYARLEKLKGEAFTAIIGDPRELGRVFGSLQHKSAWAGRIDGSGRAQSGVNRNYGRVWRIQPAS